MARDVKQTAQRAHPAALNRGIVSTGQARECCSRRLQPMSPAVMASVV